MFAGVETTTLELTASLDERAADAIERTLPRVLRLDRDAAGSGVFSMLALDMKGLGLRGVPFSPGVDYRELLHRVSVRFAGDLAWLALRCDLDGGLVRGLAARIIKYPVSTATITLDDRDGRVRLAAAVDGGAIRATFDAKGGHEVASAPPRRTFVMHRGRPFEIPWEERTTRAPVRGPLSAIESEGCTKLVDATIEFDSIATLHRERRHYCAPARPLKA